MRSSQPIQRERRRLLHRRRQRRLSARRIEFWFAIALLSPGLLGGGWLLTLWVQRTAQRLDSIPVAAQPSGLESQALPSPVALGSPALLQRAFDAATSASSLNRSAYSSNDWQLVAAQWQQAIAHLKAVPKASADYSRAQQKVKEYQGNLTYAKQQVAKYPAGMTMSVFSPPVFGKANVSKSVLVCAGNGSTTGEMPLALTQLKIHAVGSEKTLVGCITNRSAQPLTHVAVTYQVTSTQDAQFFEGGFSYLETAPLKPGETVPFRGEFTFSSSANQLRLNAVYWQLSGQSEMQGTATSKMLNF